MIRISPSELSVGMTLPWSVYSEDNLQILAAGTQVSSRRQLEALLLRGARRPGDAGPTRSDANSLLGAGSGVPGPEQQLFPFQQLDGILQRMGNAFELMLRGADGATAAREDVLDLVGLIDTLQRRYPDAMMGAAHLVHEYQYTLGHAVHSALLVALLANESGYDADRRRSLILAALLQNIGMWRLQGELQVQEMRPTPEQRRAIEAHPTVSRDLMLAVGLDDPLALDVVHQHHEVPSGKGYPRGLGEDRILDETLLLTLADRYCAKVSARAFRTPMLPRDGLRWLYMGDAGTLPEELIRKFAAMLGLYPPGSFVRLSNGEVGLVIRRGAEGEAAPVVSAYVGTNGLAYDRPLFRGNSSASVAIVKPCAPDINIPISLDVLWGFAPVPLPVPEPEAAPELAEMLSDDDISRLLNFD